MTAMECILCGGANTRLNFAEPKSGLTYYRCSGCRLVFLDPAQRLGSAEEKSRYLSHENDPAEPGYQEFLKPLVDLIVNAGGREVLDFGCGAGAPIRHVLKPLGFEVTLFDPFFYPDFESLTRSYDFIAASEVAEHMHDPAREFERLRGMLKVGGRLGVMTAQCPADELFGDWYYRRDPTHVCFYDSHTFEWMRQKFLFKEARVHSSRLVEFIA